MRTGLFFAFCFFGVPAFCQDGDSLAAAAQVDSLIKVSRDFTAKGAFDQALEVSAAAEKIALERFGRESAAYGSCCFNRGRVAHIERDHAEAEKWYTEAKAIREKVLGKEHPDFAASMNNLTILYSNMGQNEKAESHFLEAKDIFEKVLGKEHPFYVNNLNSLASFYWNKGQYEKAEPLFLESKDIRGKALGNEHPDFARSLANLATLYTYMGQYQKAEPLFLEAKDIFEKILGNEHPDFARSLSNIADFYVRKGQYEKAKPLLLEAIAIQEKVMGNEHPDFALSLNHSANLYLRLGQYEKAESLFLESIAIQEKVLGNEHPDFTQSLLRLAYLYSKMGKYEKAEPLQLESKAIREKVLGNEHPEYALSLTYLANLYSKMGQYKKAESLYFELASVDKSLMEEALRHLSEREINSYLNTFSTDQDQVLSFVHSTDSKILIPTCYDNTLFYKGFLLQAASRIKLLALSDETVAETFNRLKGCHRRLAAEYAKPIVKRDSALITQLEAQANDLEKDLARTVAGYAEAVRQIKWQEVQATLKGGEATVEFVQYQVYYSNITDSTLYAALVLHPGDTQPHFIPLFEEKSLDSLLQRNTDRNELYVKRLYSLTDRSAKPLNKPQKTLYELLWKPLEKELSSVKTIYYSPSGLLHRLNLAAIRHGRRHPHRLRDQPDEPVQHRTRRTLRLRNRAR